MTGFMDCTASQLAGYLEVACRFTGDTGTMSMLDEATMCFPRLVPETTEAQAAFVSARHDHLSSNSDDDWLRLSEAARTLAAALLPLGDMRIPRCKRQAGWGTCNLMLDPDGQCRSTMGHADEETS